MHGSSPLARGLLPDNYFIRPRRGIIPARAGFTTFSVLNNGYLRDHPRSRGVYTIIFLGAPNSAGSSPLARGLRELDLNSPSRLWIIPARAGFTRL